MKPSRWARLGRWWSRLWRVRRRRGGDFGDMGTAFGLDAATAAPSEPHEEQAERHGMPGGDADRANRRSVW